MIDREQEVQEIETPSWTMIIVAFIVLFIIFAGAS